MRRAALLISFLVCTLSTILHAQYSTIKITSGFNADVVADSIGAPTTSTTNDVDGVNYCLVAPNYQYDITCALPTLSMPASGLINSITTSGLSFQVESYKTNQDFRLTTTDSGTLTFATGISAQTVYLLAFSGSGASEINATVNFSDGTSQLFSAIKINDWFATSTNVTTTGMGRINNTVTACGGVSTATVTPIFFELSLQLNSVNYLKTITSVKIVRLNGVTGYTGLPNILAVSTLAPPTACTGKPAPGNTISSATSICPSVNFTLTLQNPLTNSAGISYQWQSSPDSITWTDIANATSASYTTNITAKTYYHCIVKCTLSNLQSTSTDIKVTTNPPALCICNPTNGTTLHGGSSPYISAVSITGTNLSINSTATPTNGYISYSSPIPNLIQGQTYTLSTTFTGTAIGSVWFDWNNNGVLEATEWTQITTSSAGGNISFTVDPYAVLGNSIMRVRIRASGSPDGATDACTEFYSGQTMDFVINIIVGTPCSGTPIPGNTVASTNKVCPNVGFNLTDTGSTFGVTGLTYQWQKSINGGSTWTDIAGADSFNHYETGGIAAATCYRRGITCSGVTKYSAPACISINPVYACYCSPNTGTTLHTGTSPTIDSVSIAGTALNTRTAALPQNGYTLNRAPIATLLQGVTYTLYSQYSGAAIASAWIDWNNDGVLDATEWYQLTTNGTSSTLTFTVPTNAGIDTTVLRIRTNAIYYTNGGGDACTSFYTGETEDFVIRIIAGSPCSGAPVAGTTVPSSSSICRNIPFNLTDTGATSGVLGLTYQWQMSANGGTTWTDIVGADSINHYESAGISVATCYRRGITCSGVTTYSKPACVTLNPNYQCYCGPNVGITLHTGTTPTLDSISITNTTLNISTAGVAQNGYTLHLSPVPTLSQGVTYTLYTQYSGAAIASAWIDWNNDGVLDATEWYQLTTNGSNSSLTFTVPATASIDSTILRIRTNATYYANNGGSACNSFYAGETEDFLVYIKKGTTCNGSPAPGITVLVSPTVLCANVPFNLAVNGGAVNQAGLTYQWQSSTDGIIYNDIPGETNLTYTNTSGITDSMYYQRMIECSGFQDFSTPILVKLTGAVNTYPFVESFESLTSVGSGILPNCWTTVGTAKFTSASAAVRNKISARTGTHFVWARYSSNSYLISPTISLTSGTSYTFSFYYRPSDPTAGFNINACVASASDTTTLSANRLGATIVNPTDTSKWKLATYTYTPKSSGAFYFAIQSNCASYSPWYLLFDDINISKTPLPVTIISFTGEKEGNKNLLNWSTANEIGNKGFEIQRSKDGNVFDKVGLVSSKSDLGNSTIVLNYTFEDVQPLDGSSYYRLRQIDLNGKETYSKVILIRGERRNKLEFTSIYPNPAKDLLNLGVYSPSSQNLHIVVTDISGRIVKQLNLLANSGDNQLNLNVDGLQAGLYVIRATCSNGCEAAVQKFLKQ